MIRKILLTCALMASSLSFAGDGIIEFTGRKPLSMDGYLTYFLMKVPLDQFEADASGQVIRLRGNLTVQFFNLPESIRSSVQEELEKALRGERQISGAYLDASDARVTFQVTEPRALDDERSEPQVIEERVVSTTEVDMEQIRQEVEQRQREEALQSADPFSCAPSLLGHFDR